MKTARVAQSLLATGTRHCACAENLKTRVKFAGTSRRRAESCDPPEVVCELTTKPLTMSAVADRRYNDSEKYSGAN